MRCIRLRGVHKIINALIVTTWSSKIHNADTYLLHLLNKGLKSLNVNSNILYVGDYLFRTPKIFQLFNTPLFLKEFNKYDIIIGWGLDGSYIFTLSKYLLNTNTICRVVGILYEEACLNKEIQPDSQLKNSLIKYESLIMQKLGSIMSDYYITCSENLRKFCIKTGINEKNVIVIRNSVDTRLFRPLPQLTENKSKIFTVLYAGGFQEWQGINNLIEASVLLKNHDIKFKIIGFNKNQIELKNHIKNKLENKVELIDRLSRKELVMQINKSEVCIIPRSSNIVTEVAFPTKFAEYLSVGKPVITTNVGEISLFVKKYNCGYVCKPDPISIADTIMKAKNDYNNSLEIKSSNSRKLALNEFDNLVITKKFIDFMNDVLY